MIEASTTMPTAKARPASEITLIESPSHAIATKVPTTETGIAQKIMIVGMTERMKANRIASAISPPIKIFCLTSEMADPI